MPPTDTTTAPPGAMRAAETGRLRVSLYPSERETKPRACTGEWSDAVELVTRHRRTPCTPCPGKSCPDKRGPAFSFAELKPGASRGVAGVLAVHAFAADVDHGSLEKFVISWRLLKGAGLACAVGSTHSHAVDAPRFRVLIRLSRPVYASEWAAFWSTVNAMFKLEADPATRDAARLYFTASAPEGAKVFAWSQEGAALDVDAALKSAGLDEISGVRLPLSSREWAALLGNIGEGARNCSLTRLAGLLLPKLGAALGAELVRAVNQARCRPPLPPLEVERLLESVARRELSQRVQR